MTSRDIDKYQRRYISHQKRKRKAIESGRENKPFQAYKVRDWVSLTDVMKSRRSRRLFSGEEVDQDEMRMILKYAKTAPSSCDRKAIKMIVSKKGIGTLVGGRDWVEKADKVILLYADMLAYKSPAEVDFMPYLDTGFVAQNIYLVCEVLNIACCFVNPNRTGGDLDREGMRFCGCIALGKIKK